VGLLLALAASVATLTGSVGANDAFQIGLVDGSGAAVTHVDPGTYTLVVHDLSTLHNFHLFGPGGVDVATAVDTTGDSTFTVTLVDGIYTFQCDPHSFSGMRRQFAVGTATLPAPPAKRTVSKPTVSKLTGSLVGTRARLAGTAGLKAGRAVIRVTDRSRTDGFVLRGPGVSRVTGVAARGAVTWSVTLRAGTYTYGSLRHPAARRTLVVSPT
jgi:plastocyanin